MTDISVAEMRDDLTRQCAETRWGEAAAVVVLLGFERVTARDEFARHVTRAGIWWEKIADEACWSAGERFLIQTAAGLWSGRAAGADVSLLRYLSDDFYTVWLAMVTASRTGVVPGVKD